MTSCTGCHLLADFVTYAPRVRRYTWLFTLCAEKKKVKKQNTKRHTCSEGSRLGAWGKARLALYPRELKKWPFVVAHVLINALRWRRLWLSNLVGKIGKEKPRSIGEKNVHAGLVDLQACQRAYVLREPARARCISSLFSRCCVVRALHAVLPHTHYVTNE